MTLRRIAGEGWLALVGGGEFSFGETREADAAWLPHAEDPIGFLPTASGSIDYAVHLGSYLEDEFGRGLEAIPVYRRRDARRGRNVERVEGVRSLYIGGGVTDHLLGELAETPVLEAIRRKIVDGGLVVAIAAAAQAAGAVARSLLTRQPVAGMGWVAAAAFEPNFLPGQDRRLRELVAVPGIEVGLGLSAGSALLLGPGGVVETCGEIYRLTDPEGEAEPFS